MFRSDSPRSSAGSTTQRMSVMSPRSPRSASSTAPSAVFLVSLGVIARRRHRRRRRLSASDGDGDASSGAHRLAAALKTHLTAAEPSIRSIDCAADSSRFRSPRSSPRDQAVPCCHRSGFAQTAPRARHGDARRTCSYGLAASWTSLESASTSSTPFAKEAGLQSIRTAIRSAPPPCAEAAPCRCLAARRPAGPPWC